MRKVTVVVLGEADSGKSSLLEKFLDPSTTIQPASDEFDEWRYSDMQTEMPRHTYEHTTADGETVTVTLLEVPGARGRMTNWHHLSESMRIADSFIVTDRVFARSDWNPIGRHLPYTHFLASTDKKQAPRECVYVATGIDVITDKDERAALIGKLTDLSKTMTGCRGAFFTSAVTNESVREAIEAAIALAMSRSEPIKKVTLLHKIVALFSRKSAIKAAPKPAVEPSDEAAGTLSLEEPASAPPDAQRPAAVAA